MKRVAAHVLIIVLSLSVSAPHAHSSVTPGKKCSKAGVEQIDRGKSYTCVKSGNKLVWNKGKKVGPASKPSKPAKEIDYSTCLMEGQYQLARLATLNLGDLFSAGLENQNTRPKFGYDVLKFTNKTPCKVKIQISADLQCYGPLGSQAYSYDMPSRTGEIQVSENSSISIDAGEYFSDSKYYCESQPSKFVSLGMRNRLTGPPFLNFGSSVASLVIRVEGADPVKPYKEVITPTPTPTPTT